MGMKKIKQEVERYADKAYHEGYKWGFKDGSESEELRDELFQEGVRAERQRIINLFNMLSAQELETGSGNKAKAFKEVVDLIKVADLLENAEDFVDDEF